MGIPSNPNQPETDKATWDGTIKPPQIEWIKNDPKTTKHLPCPSSSWIESFSYDPGTLRLTVTAKNGSTWQHGQFYENAFKELQLAHSKGSYYTKSIKGNHPTTTVIKTPKLRNYPGRSNEKTSFENPLHKTFDRYGSAGRYGAKNRYGT